MRLLEVPLGERAYTIAIGHDLRAVLAGHLDRLRADRRPVAAVVDGGFAAAQPAWLAEVFAGVPVFTVPSGETSKSYANLAAIHDFLAANRVDRSGCLFAVGGGVVGDLAGFAAASWMRGIDFIQVPTTLLAMVDSSVGGKTGINIKAGKNLVGAFHQPRAVVADTALLRTLPPREFAAGMAEIVKYGMLADADLFARLESMADGLLPGSPELPAVIERCCAIKADVVRLDERETAAEGGRALLNLGHTFGHAIEAVAGYGDYLHGEAVAVGLVLATELSVSLGLMEPAAIARVRATLGGNRLPVALRRPLPVADLVAAMGRDKKVRQGGLRFVVMEALGTARTRDGVPMDLVERLWRAAGAV